MEMADDENFYSNEIKNVNEYCLIIMVILNSNTCYDGIGCDAGGAISLISGDPYYDKTIRGYSTGVTMCIGAPARHSYAVHGVKFETMAEFSAPARAGVDAIYMMYPGNSKQGAELMSITAVLFTKETQKKMGMNDAGLLNYTKTTFLGTAARGKRLRAQF
jgi:hypothetical protein